MSNVNPSVDRQASFHGGVIMAIWGPLTQATLDTGGAIELAGFSEKSFHVFGTFGAGGSVLIEGSNEVVPVNWAPLTNRQGTAMAITTLSFNTSQDRPRWVRPRVTAGDGTTSLSVGVACHRFDISLPGGG